jgi:octaheme c-type cytochrome (tetrathionate reductase family)
MNTALALSARPAALLAAALLAWVGAGPETARAAVASHRNLTSYTDSYDCTTECHESAALEVMHTSHWTWLHTNSATGQVEGKRNVINNYCVALPSNEPRCTSCHVGVGWRDKTFDFSDASKVDCLVCHDTTGTYKKFPTLAGAPWTGPGTTNFGGVAYPPVDLAHVAQNVGRSSRATCGACHFYGGGGDAVKHGDLDSSLFNPSRDLDVHMGVNGQNLQCADCHETTAHEIPGSIYSKDHTDDAGCQRCHSGEPHQAGSLAAQLNRHGARVACQTCHIPEFARGKATMMTWDWSTAGVRGTNGQNQIIRDANGNPVYDTQKGSFTWATNVRPTYVWFNGRVDYLTVTNVIDPARRVAINRYGGQMSDPRAKIFPAKRFTGKQPYDAVRNVMAVPHLFPGGSTDTNAYWRGFNWTNALAAGMAYVGQPFSGQVGWVETEMYWIENHMVAPKERALSCGACHAETGGRLDFAALGYTSNQVAFLQSTKPWQGADHAGRFPQGYNGSSSCTSCHQGKTEEVMDSVHYTWRTPNPKLAYPGGGSHGMIDRFCALVGSSAMVNFYADLGEHKGSTACGKCHIGQELPFPNPATGQYTQSQKENVDCLICHATEGNYDMTAEGIYDEHDAEATHRTLMTNQVSGRRYWFQDRSLRAAESVGRGRIGTAECLRCHEHGQAAPDYKRGTPYKPEHDVHAAAGLRCTECHEVDQHKMARGSRVSDMHAWERQDVEVDCSKCHGAAPHPEPSGKPYNEHAAYIACETCHVPWTSGASRRIWYSTYGVTNGPEASLPKLDPQTGVYEPYSDYSNDYSSRPAYRWFNGGVSMLAEPLHDPAAWDFRVASMGTPGAKIYPFRPIVNGMVMDRRGFGYDPNFNPQFTMLGAMDAMADPLKMMGFMRPEGLNQRERQVLAQFPNLLGFDKEHYVRTGDVKQAVNIGLGRMGLMMAGQDAWGAPPAMVAGIGSNFWSGDLLGLDLPNNPADPTYDPTAGPTEVTGSFISLNHAVKRWGALRCQECHATNSVLDFRALSYTPTQSERLKTLLSTLQFISNRRVAGGLELRWSCQPGHSYQLLAAPDVANGPWTPVGQPIYALARWHEHLVPEAQLNQGQHVFYRVVDVTP